MKKKKEEEEEEEEEDRLRVKLYFLIVSCIEILYTRSCHTHAIL